ncbi:hypothetical protein FACS1894104_1430 [Actinomycetota bacterium]|nr:hypothetical protein FACS1894104_1430 [Actinomycetota bacterium]
MDFFLPAFGNRPEHLVGRDSIINDFINGLSKPVGHPVRATLYTGLRGMGKTALLLELASRAESVDFVVARVTANEFMLDEIIQTIQHNGSEYVKTKKRVEGFSVGALGFSFGLTFNDETERKYGFRIKLSLLAEELAKYGKGILILVDEVDGNSKVMRELAITYQHLIGENHNIAIALAGLPAALSAVLNDKVLTFLNRANKIELGLLAFSDISLYFDSVFKKLGKTISAKVLDHAVSATLGYPYLLQLIGYYVLEYTASDTSIEIDTVDKAVLSSKREMVSSIFATSLNPLSQRDREFLQHLALEGDCASIATIRERLKVSQASVQQTRARLLDSGVITAPRRGEIAIALPYLGTYLRGEF